MSDTAVHHTVQGRVTLEVTICCLEKYAGALARERGLACSRHVLGVGVTQGRRFAALNFSDIDVK